MQPRRSPKHPCQTCSLMVMTIACMTESLLRQLLQQAGIMRDAMSTKQLHARLKLKALGHKLPP